LFFLFVFIFVLVRVDPNPSTLVFLTVLAPVAKPVLGFSSLLSSSLL
jgi:hypothetical protein